MTNLFTGLLAVSSLNYVSNAYQGALVHCEVLACLLFKAWCHDACVLSVLLNTLRTLCVLVGIVHTALETLSVWYPGVLIMHISC